MEKEKEAAQRATIHQNKIEDDRRRQVYLAVLKTLELEACSWGGLMVFVFDPTNFQGNARFHGFFSEPDRVNTVLNHWISASNRSQQGRDTVRDWALTFVASLIFNEGEAVKEDGFLRTQNRVIDRAFALDLDFTKIRERLQELCPGLLLVLGAFSTSARQTRTGLSQEAKEQKDRVRTLSMSHQFSCQTETIINGL